jgi:hypothetical protein
MKVAILLSGQPRNYYLGYDELKKSYLDKYDCDVYLHTWKGGNFEATQFFYDRPKQIYKYSEGYLNDIIGTFKPTEYSFEEAIVFDDKNIVDPIWRQPLQNAKSMWYSVSKAYDLIEKDYDVYIRSRFDLRYEPSTLDLESLDMNKLHIWNWDTDERVKHRGYYDVFAIGNKTNMGIYSSVYSKIDWYLNYDRDYVQFLKGGWPEQDSGLRNEYLLRWHLTQANVDVEIHNTEMQHADGQIIR